MSAELPGLVGSQCVLYEVKRMWFGTVQVDNAAFCFFFFDISGWGEKKLFSNYQYLEPAAL